MNKRKEAAKTGRFSAKLPNLANQPWPLLRHIVGPYESDEDCQRCSRCGEVLPKSNSAQGVRPEGTFATISGGVIHTVGPDDDLPDCVAAAAAAVE